LDFMIVNCYTPQPCTSFDWLTELGGKGRCLVTADFNVRDSSWERDYESSSPTLTAQIDNSDFIVLNDGSFTRIPDRSDQKPVGYRPDPRDSRHSQPVVRSGK